MNSDTVVNIPIFTRELADLFSSWDVFLFVVTFFVSVALVMYWMLPIIASYKENNAQQIRIAGTLVGVVGAFYGILFGFVNITLWQNFQKTQEIINNEATALAAIVVNDAAFSPEIQAKLNDTVKNYILEVKNNEWTLMRSYKSSPQAESLSVQLLTLMQSYTPKTATELPYYTLVLNKINQVLDLRRARFDAVKNKVPAPLFRVLSLGSILLAVLLGIVIFEAGGGLFLLFMNIIVNILIAFNLSLVLDLDNTFSGQVALSPAPYFYGQLQKTQ